ncbi:intercellular adhesion molecule 5 isoform X2 [Acanthopagrus latus]|uniref:intercellular adhesion molecule 5 isoform X2 n=1 Tax=Acanthopagrus latus TaxID=8177 RepID=UPI00187C23E7|nr:intercellular adhesion molecule 5 isoform X2 [Acanthopagrus latus]
MLSLRMLGILMLMFLLCDADSLCPDSINPLRLDPPEVIGKYGDTVLVNCSSSEEYLDGMVLKLGNTNHNDDDDENFISESLSLSDWSVKAECRINLNETVECSRELGITIYKTPDTVTLYGVDGAPMVEGAEYTLDCHVNNVAPVQKLTVIWYRDNEMFSTETFNENTVTPVNVSSSLRVTADRHHNGALFRCEAELHLGPELNLTTASLSYPAVVHYGPLIKNCSGPFSGLEDEFRLDMLPCHIDGNPPPTVQWYYQNMEIGADELLKRQDSGEYTVVFKNAIRRSHSSIDITIEYRPSFACNDHYEVKEGDFSQTLCEPEGLPRPNITWLKDGEVIPTPQRWTRHDSGSYSLRATNKHGTATHALDLDVLYCPLILTPAEVVVRFGDPVSVNCSTASTTDFLGMSWEASAGGTGFEDKSSLTWTVEKVDEWDIKPQCYMTRRNGKQCFMTPDITVYKTPDTVTLSGVDGAPMVEGAEYTLDCHVNNVAPVQKLTVIWYRDNEMFSTETFNENTVTPVNVSSSLRVTADRHHNGELFRCEAELHLGPELNLTTASLSYPAVVHYGPSFACNDHYEVKEGDFSQTLCEPEGLPRPNITWLKDGEVIPTPQRWTRHDSGSYSLRATNKHGTATHALDLDVLYCPLILTPAEVVVRFGDPVSVNCSTASTTDFLGMSWEASAGGTGFEDKSSLTWTVEKVDEWDIKPQCYMTRRNGKQCFMTPDITVYKTPDTVTLSGVDGAPMVEGAEYTLDCHVNNVAPVQKLTVIWYRDNEMFSTETFNENTVTPVNVSSSLRVTADRHRNGELFRCEAELQLGPELNLTTASLSYPAVVHYGPLIKNCSGPFSGLEDEFRLDMLPCHIDGNPPPTVQWYYQNMEIGADELLKRQDSGEYTVVFKNAIGRNHSSIDITIEYRPSFACNDHYEVKEGDFSQTLCEPEGLPRPNITWLKDGEVIPTPQRWTRHDSGSYSLRATNKHGTATHALYLDVLYCPLILTPAEVVVRFGDPVSVNCSTASTTDFLGMGWEASAGGTGFEDKSFLTWTVEKVDEWDIKPQCYMTRRNGKQCFMTPDITVYKTPDTVTLSGVDGAPMVEGAEYTLDCHVNNVAPVQKLTVIWYRDNEKFSTETFDEKTVTPVSVSSSLRVTADRHRNGALFRCEAELHLGPELNLTTASLSYPAVVLYGPLIKNCSGPPSVLEDEFRLDMLPCHADGNPPPTVQWYYQNTEIGADKLLRRQDSGKYTAVFKNDFGRNQSSIDITIEYGPSFTCNDYYEVREDGSSQTTCEPEGLPRPNIIWLKDGEVIPTPQRWTRHDSGNYSLRATNKHGTATHALYLDVLYAPVLQEGNDTPDVVLGENVTFPCSAEGNPPPEIQWNYKYMPNTKLTETTGRRQRNITITGATSTNTGVYICTATNEFGTMTRAVTLVVKEKSGRNPSKLIWLLLLLLLFIPIIYLIVRCRQKKRGEYNFVPSRATDGSDIPLTPTSNGVKT